MGRMSELTQEQIDAMLRGEDLHIDTEDDKVQGLVNAAQAEKEQGGARPSDAPAMATPKEAVDEIKEDITQYLSEDEVDALGEIGNIAMGTSATTMSAILGHRVLITTPQVELFKPENALTAYRCPFLAVTVGYLNGLEGKNLLILKEYDAAVITDVMMGGDGNIEWNRASSLSEIHFSAISEIMNQMIGSSATAMSNMLGVTVNITPPQAVRIDVGEDVSTLMGPSNLLIRTSFDMEIEGILKSTLLQIMPLDLAGRMIQSQLTPEEAPAPKAPPVRAAAFPAVKKPEPRRAAPLRETQQQTMVPVKKAVCQNFEEEVPGSIPEDIGNLELINDIPLQVTVELGKTHKSLLEVMHFGVGTVVMLDRLAGEPVDVIVNGKRIAKGEVVVIDENYGVRINEIFSDSRS